MATNLTVRTKPTTNMSPRIKPGWEIGFYYVVGVSVYHNGIIYRCKVAHTATADNEPGVGVSYLSYWGRAGSGFDSDTFDNGTFTGPDGGFDVGTFDDEQFS